jgi:glycosyltransferase involved in cell wall biosynthesis
MFTIVVTHFNRSSFLLKAIKSFPLESSLLDEVIIVDNGSGENELSKIREMIKKFPKTRLILHPSGNANAARNIGFMSSNSEWICFCDDDDYFCKDKLSYLFQKINSKKNIDIIYNAVFVSFFGSKLGYKTKPKVTSTRMDPAEFIVNRLGSTSGMTIKKDALSDVGGFDEHLNSLQDYELYLRLALHGSQILVLDEALTIYFKGLSDSQVSSGLTRLNESFLYIEEKHSKLFSSIDKDAYLLFIEWKKRLNFQKGIESGRWLEAVKESNAVGLRYKLICILRYIVLRAASWFCR